MKNINLVFNCKSCGKDVSHKPSNRRSFCNYGCYVEWTRSESSPLKKRESRSCKECGKTFFCVHSSEKKFCSSSCSAKHCNKNRDYDPKSISEKIKKAYGPPKEVEFNPLLNWVKTLIFWGEEIGEFSIERKGVFQHSIAQIGAVEHR